MKFGTEVLVIRAHLSFAKQAEKMVREHIWTWAK